MCLYGICVALKPPKILVVVIAKRGSFFCYEIGLEV